jgi:hypothetical protein
MMQSKSDKSYISSSTSQSIPTHHKTKHKHSILSKTKTNPIPSPHKEACLTNIPKTSQLALLTSS